MKSVRDKNMEYFKNIIYSQKEMSCESRFQQLAEECAEACQAALKVVRTLNEDNPTTISTNEAVEHLVEEISDIKVCLDLIGLGPSKEIMEQKAERLVKRLYERGK